MRANSAGANAAENPKKPESLINQESPINLLNPENLLSPKNPQNADNQISSIRTANPINSKNPAPYSPEQSIFVFTFGAPQPYGPSVQRLRNLFFPIPTCPNSLRMRAICPATEEFVLNSGPHQSKTPPWNFDVLKRFDFQVRTSSVQYRKGLCACMHCASSDREREADDPAAFSVASSAVKREAACKPAIILRPPRVKR